MLELTQTYFKIQNIYFCPMLGSLDRCWSWFNVHEMYPRRFRDRFRFQIRVQNKQVFGTCVFFSILLCNVILCQYAVYNAIYTTLSRWYLLPLWRIILSGQRLDNHRSQSHREHCEFHRPDYLAILDHQKRKAIAELQNKQIPDSIVHQV